MSFHGEFIHSSSSSGCGGDCGRFSLCYKIKQNNGCKLSKQVKSPKCNTLEYLRTCFVLVPIFFYGF